MSSKKLTRSQSMWNVPNHSPSKLEPARSISVTCASNLNLSEGSTNSKSVFGRLRKQSGNKSWKEPHNFTGPCHSGEADAVDSHGRSLLFYAARYGQLDVASQLIRAGCSPTQKDLLNNTPLHEALEKGHFDIADVFLREGIADVNIVGFNGETPLMAAVTRGQIDALKLLRCYKADVNICDAIGNSPIHQALQRGWCEIADFLLDSKCDVNKRAANGMTCFFAAAHSDKIDVTHIANRLLETDYDFKMDAGWLYSEGCPVSELVDPNYHDQVLIRAGLLPSKSKQSFLSKGTRKFRKAIQRLTSREDLTTKENA